MTNRASRTVRLGIALISTGVLVGLTAAATTASARVDARPQAKAATPSVTLVGWGGNPTETRALALTLQAAERALRIDIKYTPISGDYDAAMLARFAARRPPDVFYVDSLDVPDYLPALEPLNDEIRRDKFNLKVFYPRLLAAFRDSRGTIYGFPKDWSPLGLIANTRMLSAAGVRAPTTWAQMTSALQRIRSRNAVPGGAPACLSLDWARLLAFAYQNGGAWLSPDKRRSVVNSPQVLQAVARYLSWIQSGLARTPAQLGVGWCGEALGKEKAAIIFEGNWVPGYMRDEFPNVRFQVFPMIRNKARGNLGFTVSYSIGRHSRNKAQAWRLVKFLVGRQGMAVWTRNVGYLPSRTDVRPAAGRGIFLREAPITRPWQFIKGFDRVYDLANKELEAAFEGKQSNDVMLRKIHQATQEAIRRARR
jgi:multiple sugar transport system substrate-binding protein